MTQLTINPVFKDLIPPLSKEEQEALTESIISQGCRDTIKVWKNTIVDGHNRYAICQKHNIPYRVQAVRFSSKKDAEIWIVENQLGRRNLTTAMRINLALHKVEILKEKARQNRSLKGCEPIHVRKIVAKDASTSERNVQKYLRIIAKGDKDLIEKVYKGELKIGTAYNMLEVVVKTVEVLRERTADSNVDDPNCMRGILNNFEWIEGVYRFVLGKAWFVGGLEVALLVKKRLVAQLRVVEGLVKDVGLHL